MYSEKVTDKLLSKKHRNFKQHIEKCPVNELIEWRLNDVCVNSDCNEQECICAGRLNYLCNQYFCSRDETSCQGVKSWMDTKRFGGLKFKRC